MKLTEYMRFPHPVLSESTADYHSGGFSCGFEHSVTNDGELRLISDLRLDSPRLAALVDTQAAAVGYFLVCRRTYFNNLQRTGLGRIEKLFDVNRLFGTVTIRPVVWTLQAVDDLSTVSLDPEFGPSPGAGKGSIVALGPEFRFSMDQKKYKPFDSIFELDLNEAVEPDTFVVDAEGDRIKISARAETYLGIAQIRQTHVRDILLSAVYLPALAETISRLNGENSYDGRNWHRVLKSKCDDLGIELSTESPLAIAQKLLKGPIRKTIAMMESL